MVTSPGHRRSLAALGVLTALRLLVAGVMPLSPDEAYYWVWSRALQPGYLDHPPMVALWVRAGTALLGPDAVGVRLLAPLAAAAGSVLLAGAADRLFPLARPGLWAAALLNATPMFAVGAVTMTPDTPLLFFWAASLYGLARLAGGGGPAWWLAVGAAAGLALDSKYTAGLLGAGIALWLITPAMRPALRTAWPWCGGALAMAAMAPILLWNARHGWASLAKQGGRAADWHPSLRYLGELIAGQLGLATPIIAVLMVAGIAAAARSWRAAGPGLLAALTLPGAALFLQHAAGDRVQANWVAVLYPAGAIAAAAYAGRWRRPALALGVVVSALAYAQAAFGPLPLPPGMDPTLRLAGFQALGQSAAAAARQDGDTFLASEEYGLAALLAWHGGLPVVASEPRWRLFDMAAPPAGAQGLLVLSARRTRGPDPARWIDVQPAGSLERSGRGAPLESYRLYRVTPRPDAAAVVIAPRD